jgi:DUF1009 family protein
VIGPRTIQSAAEGKVRAIVLEAGRTLVLEAEEVRRLAERSKVAVWGHRGGAGK